MAVNTYSFSNDAKYAAQKAWCDTNKVPFHVTRNGTERYIRLTNPTAGQITQMTTGVNAGTLV